MSKTKKITVALVLIILLLAFCCASSFLPLAKTKANASGGNLALAEMQSNTYTDDIIKSVIQRKSAEFGTDKANVLSHNKFLMHAASGTADWFAFALARYGFNGDYNYYVGHVNQIVTKRVLAIEQMKDTYPSDWQRLALTIAATGADPSAIGLTKNNEFINIYENAYYNVLAQALNSRGVSAWIWTLITVGALKLPDKIGSELSKKVLIEKLSQLSHADGGFGLGEKSDADVTCMALTALSFFKSDGQLYAGKTVNKIIEDALIYLESQISEQCTLSSYGITNAPSTAWGLIALSALGLVDDVRFVKNSKTLQDGLYSFYLEGGGFSHAAGGQYESRATEQALYALVAVQRYRSGKPSLFDLSDKTDLIVSSSLTENDRLEAANLINLPQNTGLFFKAARLFYLIMRQGDYVDKATDLSHVNYTLAMIIEIEREISSINQNIEKLMPIKKLKASDKSKIEAILMQINKLSDYDAERIENYSGLMQAKKHVENKQVSLLVTFCIIAALVAASVVLIISRSCRKSKRQVESRK